MAHKKCGKQWNGRVCVLPWRHSNTGHKDAEGKWFCTCNGADECGICCPCINHGCGYSECQQDDEDDEI